MATGQPPERTGTERAAWAEEQITLLLRSPDYRGVHGLIRRRGFSTHDTDDVLAISIAAVYGRLMKDGPVRGSLMAYFTGVVHHAMAQYKRDESRETVDLPGDEVLTAQPADRTLPGPSEGRSLSPERLIQLEAILTALGELPGHLREPYEVELYVGLKPAEIASILGKTPASIRAYLSVAEARVTQRVASLLQLGECGKGEGDE